MSTAPASVTLDLPAVAGFLREHGEPVSGKLECSLITGGRSNLTFRVWDKHRIWVLRCPPTVGRTPSAHDVGREYRVVRALAGTGIPVPEPIAYCTDPSLVGGPFSVVRFIDGRTLRTRREFDELADAQIADLHRGLIGLMVKLHSVDFEAIGLADFGRPLGFFQRQVRRWRDQWALIATEPMADVDRLCALLAERTPRQTRASIVHGDFRIDNTLVDKKTPRRILALVDWEMATVGDPLTDVALMCAYRHPAFDHVVGEPGASTSPRWPSTDKILGDYAAASGLDISEIDSYLGLAYLKLAVIAQGIACRFRLGAGQGPGFATAEEAVPGLIAAGLAALGGRHD